MAFSFYFDMRLSSSEILFALFFCHLSSVAGLNQHLDLTFSQEPGQGPSRLILLAGKTGEVIGSVKLPKGEGILMPPVKYVTNEKATYILLASGGGSSAGRYSNIVLHVTLWEILIAFSISHF